jgi:hypothetical protein
VALEATSAASEVVRVLECGLGVRMDTKTFCKLLSEGLEQDSWGTIEPDVFINIANGVSDATDDDLCYDKMDAFEMEDSVKSMTAILDRIFAKD